MMWFSKLFFDYVPLYNKFRTVSMALTALQVLIPLLGVLAVNQMLFPGNCPVSTNKVRKSLFISLGVTIGLCLLFALVQSMAGSFVGANDVKIFDNNKYIIGALMEDRRALLRADAFRSMMFILGAAIVLYLAYIKKIKAIPATALIGVLIFIDLWSVDRRYLNGEDFITPRNFNAQYNPRPVDKMILQDNDPHYRVLDMSVNTFNNSITSYHHKTIGGYNPAKIQRYQDLIDFHLKHEIDTLADDFYRVIKSGAQSIGEVSQALSYQPVLAMLNTKYIIIDGNSAPLEYRYRLGNAWFVEKVYNASSADDEMDILGQIDLRTEAVIYDAPESLADYDISVHGPEMGSEIYLTHYSPNRLEYSFSCHDRKVAVFSEIYYPAGWKAYVNGEEKPILRADYALRALELEAGEGTIEFVYDPVSFKTGKAVSLASSITILVLFAAAVASEAVSCRRRRKNAC